MSQSTMFDSFIPRACTLSVPLSGENSTGDGAHYLNFMRKEANQVVGNFLLVIIVVISWCYLKTFKVLFDPVNIGLLLSFCTITAAVVFVKHLLPDIKQPVIILMPLTTMLLAGRPPQEKGGHGDL